MEYIITLLPTTYEKNNDVIYMHEEKVMFKEIPIFFVKTISYTKYNTYK